MLNAIGVVLVLVLLGGVVLVVVTAVSPPESTTGAPDANWTLERVNQTHVKIAHAGGEPVSASELLVTVGGDRRVVTVEGVVAEGDAFIVAAEEGAYVQLYWTGGEGGADPLATWQAA